MDSIDLKKIKLIVSDLDGTIIYNFGEIRPSTLEMVKKLDEANISFVPASGRAHFDIMHSIDPFKPHPKYTISINGAIVKEDGKVIFSQPIEPNTLKMVCKFFEDNEIIFCMYGKEYVYEFSNPKINYSQLIPMMEDTFGDQSYFSDLMRCIDSCDDLKEPIYKMETWITDTSKTMDYIEELKKLPGIEVANSDMCIVEVTTEGVSKGNAVNFLMDYLNVTPEETMVLGDSMNDYSMFFCGCHNVVPDNALDALKQKAEIITDSCKDEGIERYLLSKLDN